MFCECSPFDSFVADSRKGICPYCGSKDIDVVGSQKWYEVLERISQLSKVEKCCGAELKG